MMYDLTLHRVKKPEECRALWDYRSKVADIPGDPAFLQLSTGACPYVKHEAGGK